LRFQTTETVQIADTEKVLHALEVSLRELSDEVHREGHKITVHGVGPSPRARNYRDTAIFQVATKKGSTKIDADVTFQASALIGTSSQDAVVRSKLDYAFDQMRLQLNLPEAVREAVPEPVLQAAFAGTQHLPETESHASDAVEAVDGLADELAELGHFTYAEPMPEYVVEPHAVPLAEKEERGEEDPASPPSLFARLSKIVPELLEDEPVGERATTDEVSDSASPPSLFAALSRVVPELLEEEPVGERAATDEVSDPASPPSLFATLSRVVPELLEDEPVGERVSADAVSEPVTPFGSWAASLRSFPVPPHAPAGDSVNGQSDSFAEEDSETPAFSVATTGDSHKTNLPILLAVLLGVVVAAGSVYLYWTGLLKLNFAHQMISAPAAPTPPAVQEPVAFVPVPTAPPRHEEPNPKVWLEQWADALRGRDADLQASFYADPVGRYMGDSDVSKDALTNSFRSAIQVRDGLWTMKLERVSIDSLSATHVVARLTKHFMQLDDSSGSASQIADHYVRSRLDLRRVDGEWKIESEQDMNSANAER